MAAAHIVVIPSWYAGGRGSGGGYFRDQALALQAAGHRVAMLVPEIYTGRDVRAGRAFDADAGQTIVEDDGLPVYSRRRRIRLPRLPYRNAMCWSLCGLRLFRDYVARNGLPDLVHAHSALNAGVLAALIRARHGVPFILSEHSTGFAQQRLRRWERRLVRFAAARADACIAVSPHLARLLDAQFPGKSWEYVPNILGADFLGPAPPRLCPTDHGSPRPFTFLCAARMDPVKNHALLIDAFADAFPGGPGVRLRLAGDGPTRPELQRLSEARGIADRIEFLGAVSAAEMRAAMEQADAFALASDFETFGVVVIEAQSAGLPVVCTASGGPDHLIDTGNGILVPVGDRAALAAALIEMRQNACRYDGARISATAVSRFGPQAFVRDFTRLWPERLQALP